MLKTIHLIKNQGFDAIIGSPVAVELALNENLVGHLAISVPSLKTFCKMPYVPLKRFVENSIQPYV